MEPEKITEEQLERQRAAARSVKALHAAGGRRPLAFVDTYGCQQNEADSEKLRGMLREMGYGPAPSEQEADVVVLNTCAVREHAEQRVLGNVGALSRTKRERPDQILALCGCMMQQPHMAEKIQKSYRHVDLVFGPHALWRFPSFIEKILRERGRVFAVEESAGVIAEDLPLERDKPPRAWLSVMYGCNNFCSYCIVPYVRGRERSRTFDAVLQEAAALVARGYRDLTLLGQNVNSYGRDSGGETDFAALLEAVCAIPGDFLVRFMTSHPKDATERLFKTMASNEKAARHLHLPFQAGSDRVLAAMNRGYTKEEYLSLVALARKYMPDLVLTSDVIVGFPGETDADFSETLDILARARFDALFTFLYSKREGTPAAAMPDSAGQAEKQARFDRLLALQNGISAQRHQAYVGTEQKILIDGSDADARFRLTGRTNGGRLVRLDGDAALIGSFARARIVGASTWSLTGQLLSPEGGN